MNFSYGRCNGIYSPKCHHNTCCRDHCSVCAHAHAHAHSHSHSHHYQPYPIYAPLIRPTYTSIHPSYYPTHYPTPYSTYHNKVQNEQKMTLTKPVTSNNFFKIVIVLDESGSMGGIKDSMRSSINDLIMEQKQVEGRQATFTLVKFNNKVNRVVENIHLNDVRDIRENEYRPNGTTALYDAIGNTVDWFRNEKDVLMVIVTDGAENSSKSYKKHDITRMIKDKETNNNWSYVYLSCDLNTFAQGNNIGLNESTYASNCVVEQKDYGNFVSQNLNSAISNYRNNGTSVQSQLNSNKF